MFTLSSQKIIFKCLLSLMKTPAIHNNWDVVTDHTFVSGGLSLGKMKGLPE